MDHPENRAQEAATRAFLVLGSRDGSLRATSLSGARLTRPAGGTVVPAGHRVRIKYNDAIGFSGADCSCASKRECELKFVRHHGHYRMAALE